MSEEKLTLVAPGALGTCWYGKYHYMEPFVGCAHDCIYCYAKFRSPVTDKLNELKANFSKPVPIMEPEKLLKEIKKAANSGEISILKLSRYTDIFNPEFVKNGLSYEILKVLAESKVNRIIITTKGAPDQKIIDLMIANKAKFSYNVVVKPAAKIKMEGEIATVAQRLAAAEQLNKAGVLTTIHMDPLIPGYEDDREAVLKLLKTLKSHGINRVMFSYLLVNGPMIERMKKLLGEEFTAKLLEHYDQRSVKVLPKNDETFYLSMKSDLKVKSAEMIASLLTEQGFDFVLCSLKCGKGEVQVNTKVCNLCDGKFYA